MENWREKTRFFYGWWVTAALFCVLMFTGGGGFYVFPVYIDSFLKEFGWSMTQVSSAAALWAIVFGFSAPVVGTLIARFGVRKTMLTAAVCSSLSLLGLASVKNLWMLYAANLVAGFAVAGTTLVPAHTLMTNWFDRYRGRAISWAMLGIGTGGFLLPPFNELMIRKLGWRSAWLAGFLIVLVVVIPLIAVFIRTKPSDLGLLADGGGGTGGSSARITGLPAKRALGTLAFWLLACIYVLQLFGLSAMNFHFVPFAIYQAQFPSPTAATFLGLTLGFSLAGRLVFGWLADFWKPAFLLGISGLLLALGPAVLELAVIRQGVRETAPLWLYSLAFGLGIGGNAVMTPVMVSRCFGELYFSKILGLIMSGFAIGVLLGIPLSARLYDLTRSYEIPFVCCIAALGLSAVLAILVRPGRYHPEFVSGSG
ncbi:MAG: MFS transporter [bacterium]